MSRPRFRVVDSGLRTGRENIALDQAMVEAHRAGEIGDTLRFIHFRPVALVGRHQAVNQEVNTGVCRAHGIEIGRRITGGGAIYMDEDILGWAIVCRRDSLGGGSLGDLTARVCEAVAGGISRLGVAARFRPRNDIEIDGRKVSGTGGFFDADTLIYQGTVLIDLKPELMFSVLNVARDKLARRGLEDAAARVTCLTAELGRKPAKAEIIAALTAGLSEGLGLETFADTLSGAEEERMRAAYEDEIGTDEFVYEIDDPAREAGVLSGAVRGAGGQVGAHVRLEGPANNLIREVLITGDFFVTPPRLVYDLESSLRGVGADAVRPAVEAFFQRADIGLLSVRPQEFADAIEAAIASRSVPV